MATLFLSRLLIVALTGGLAACAVAERADAQSDGQKGQPLSGWYMQSGGSETIQPCGEPEPWRITDSADLPAKAKAFGLTDDSPVYVKVLGATSAADKTVQVRQVVQFGSPTPVRNCAMNGVVHKSSAQVQN